MHQGREANQGVRGLVTFEESTTEPDQVDAASASRGPMTCDVADATAGAVVMRAGRSTTRAVRPGSPSTPSPGGIRSTRWGQNWQQAGCSQRHASSRCSRRREAWRTAHGRASRAAAFPQMRTAPPAPGALRRRPPWGRSPRASTPSRPRRKSQPPESLGCGNWLRSREQWNTRPLRLPTSVGQQRPAFCASGRPASRDGHFACVRYHSIVASNAWSSGVAVNPKACSVAELSTSNGSVNS